MVTTPVRGVPAVFAWIESVTVPLPLPVAPLVTMIHAALLTAVHAQPGSAETLTVFVEAGAFTDTVVVDSVYVQAWPAWLTVKVCPATVIVAVRTVVVGFSAALNPMASLPFPVVALVTVSHEALLTAVHAQPEVAVIENDPAPPPAVSDTLDGDRL